MDPLPREYHWRGYRQCVFCEYWAHEPYVFDGIPECEIPACREMYVLCDWCFDYLVLEDGEPGSEEHWWSRRRCAITASIVNLQRWFRWMPSAVAENIAHCLAEEETW